MDDGGILNAIFMASKPGQRYYQVKNALDQQSALAKLAGDIQGNGPVPTRPGQEGPLQPSQGIDRSSALARYAGITGDFSGLLGTKTESPSNVREYQYFSNLSPDEQQKYLAVKRAQQVIDLGGSQGVLDQQGRGISQMYQKSLAPADQPANAQAKASATAEGAAVGTNQGAKEVDYPRVSAKLDQNIKLVDQTLDHPGFDANFGLAGTIPNRPGSNASDASSLIKQLQGTAYLTAIGEMKGAGSISEKEGEAATSAVGRFQKSQSAPAARKALKEYKQILSKAKERANPFPNKTSADEPKTVDFMDLK